MNCTKFFTLLLLIITLSFTIECRRNNVSNYSNYLKSIKNNSRNNNLPQPSVHVSGNCLSNVDCPIGYVCTNQMCIKQVIKRPSHREWKLLQCADKEKDCSKYEHYCRDSAYLDFLKEHCKRTCGYCQRS
uniref:ShKT domain-containing protein n=1 Tax=Strongyloides papillosus TaxID=174720 RepID=A0A0N5C143_STREA